MLQILKDSYTILLVQIYMCYSMEIESFIQALVYGAKMGNSGIMGQSQ